MRTREEHLEWCKDRARAYLAQGNIPTAIASMLSDLNKHDETRSSGRAMAMLGMLYAHDSDADEARRFIDGFL